MSASGKDWHEILTERDRQVFETAGYGEPAGFGSNPAILVIDANYAFVGLRAPILDSIQVWPQSAGLEAWEAVDRMVSLLSTARRADVPVIYTTNAPTGALAHAARKRKGLPKRRRELDLARVEEGRKIVAERAPQPGDVVIEKPYASAFFGTPLLSVLHGFGTDTLILLGGSVSGCVRAAAVDASSHNFYVIVAEDGTFDRAQASRQASLFDLNAKYADVVPMEQINAYLEGQTSKPGNSYRREAPAHRSPA